MTLFEKKCIAFLMRIVCAKSFSKRESRAAKIIASEMRRLGYDSVRIDKFHNVVGTIGRGKTKILFDAHTDTVGIAARNRWTADPFRAKISGGRLYGRGACDDKGSVAAMIYAGALAKKNAAGFTLIVSASAREEIGETQWLDFITKKLRFRPDFAVIGEPSGLKIIRGHKGRAEFKILVGGKAAHASIPHKGDNAAHKAAALVGKIAALNKKYKSAALGKPVISATKLETENASVNTIPDRCVIYVDRRSVETETRKSILSEMKKTCGVGGKIEYAKFYEPWVLDRNNPLLAAAAKTFRAVYRKNPEITTWPFCTNGSFTMGGKKIPTIGFGPGEESQAHIPDESISVGEVVKSLYFYAALPAEICRMR